MVEIVLNTAEFGPTQTITGSVLNPPDDPTELQFCGLEIIGGLLEDLDTNPRILARTYFDQRLQLGSEEFDFSIQLPPVNYPAPLRSPHPSNPSQSFEIAYQLRLLSDDQELFILPVPLQPTLQPSRLLPNPSANPPILRQALDDRGKECLTTKVTLSQPGYLPGEQIVAGVCIETPRGSRVPKRAQYQLQQRIDCRMPDSLWSRTQELSAWRPLTLTNLGVGLAATAQQEDSGLESSVSSLDNKQATANIHQSVPPSASPISGHYLSFSYQLAVSVTVINSLTRSSSHTYQTTTPLRQQPQAVDKEAAARFSLGAFQNKQEGCGVNVLKQPPPAKELFALDEAHDMAPQLHSACGGGFVTPPNEPTTDDLASAVNMAAERVLNDKEWDRPHTVYLAPQSVESSEDVQDAISQLAPAASASANANANAPSSPHISRPASSRSSSDTHGFHDFLGGLEFFDASDKLGPELTGMLSADPAQLAFGVTLAGQMVVGAPEGELQLRKSMSMPNGEGAQIVGDTVTVTSQMCSPGATTASGARSVHEASVGQRPRALVRKHWTIKGTHISARSVINAVTQSSKLSTIPAANPIARGGMLKSIGQRFSQWFN